MIIFHSDLDNTLLYSYKYDIGVSKKCVELHEGKELSFMTKYSYEMLKLLNEKICIVPTTTRDIKQYKRIHLGIGVPNYALVSNGGILLIDGRIDEAWYKESLILVSDCSAQLIYASELLQEDENRCFEIRSINDLFLFTKSKEPLKSIERLREFLDITKLDVFHNGNKVYIVPKQLNKGRAIKRLRDKLRADYVIAAGDSAFDISMALEADLTLLPEELVENSSLQKNIVLFGGPKLFSDQIMNYIIKVIENKESEVNIHSFKEIQ